MSSQTPLLKELKVVFNGKSMPITCVIMDREGVLWLGNQQGVFTYNGYQLNQLYNSNRLSKEVTTLFEDSSGYVWAGTTGGNILRFYNYQQVEFEPGNAAPTTSINSITQDKAGNIWFATRGQGVYVSQEGKLLNLNMAKGLPADRVYCLVSGYNGEVLCGTDRGIAYMSCGKQGLSVIRKLNKSSGLKYDSITALTYFEKNILVTGTSNAGAYIWYEDKQKSELLWGHGTPVTSFTVINDEIWLGTQDNGIIDCEFYPRQNIRNLNLTQAYGIVRIQQAISTPYYFQLILAENKIYISQGEWLEKIPLPDDNDDLNPKPRAVAADVNYLYAVYNYGLFKRPVRGNGEWQAVYLGQKVNFDAVSSMLVDNYGYLWIASLREGIYCIDRRNNVVNHLTGANGLIDNQITKLRIYKNVIYYGCNKGLGYVRVNNDNAPVRFAGQLGKVASFRVNDIEISKDSSALWLATAGNGIVRITDNSSRFYLENAQGDKKVIFSVARDNSDRIWYTSQNFGLYRLNNNKGESISELKNINYSAINALFIDRKDNIITIHDDFISVYNPRSRQQYSQIGDFGFTSIHYTSSMVASSNGTYYIMSKDGIYSYQGRRFEFMQKLPAFIHNINVNLQAVKMSDKGELTLGYDENHLDFQLYTPWYGNHDKIKYQYVLLGLNADTVVTSDNNIYFPNLPSGHYTLKVRPVIMGSIIDTQWAEKKFMIRKPWYKTIWFIIAFALSGFVILYFINYNFLKNQNRSNEIERQRLRQEIKILNNQINPHFLFNSLNNLISIIDIDTVNAKIYTAHLADFYRLIVAYKDNYVITLEEDLRISRIYIALQNIRFSDAIIYKVRVPDNYFKCYLPPLTLQILVENAIKHNKVSQSQPLHIDISVEKEYLIIKNKISPKENLETSTKSGIRFIVDRFDFITKAKPEIVHTETEFIVKVPLIFNEPLPA